MRILPAMILTASLCDPSSPAATWEYALTALDLSDVHQALVLGPSGIPLPSQDYLATVDQLYLQPQGFTGQVSALDTPEWDHTTDESMLLDESVLFRTIMDAYRAGDLSATDPLVVFAYSQSAAAASEVMYQLYDAGVPTADLDFVLVGDSGSPDGLVNRFIPSLPAWLQEFATRLVPMLHLAGVVTDDDFAAPTTPDFYPTEVYTLPGDGYAFWPQNILDDPLAALRGLAGLFSTHLEYLGLSPAEVIAALPALTDGLTQYLDLPTSVESFADIINAGIGVGWL